MEKILREILSQDKTILSRRDELIAELDKKVTGDLSRSYAPIKRAINSNVGEIFFVGESDKEATKEKVREILKSSGMQEARINFVIETFINALDWDKPQISESPEPDPEPEPPVPTPEPEPPQSKPQPEPPMPNPPNPPPVSTPTQNEIRISKNSLIAIIGIFILTVAIIWNNVKNDSRPNTPAQSNQIEQSQPEPQIILPADEPDSYKRGRSELSFNGMDVGITTAELERNLGKPDRIENLDGGYVRYWYGNFYAAIKDGIIDAFVSRESRFQTLRGISTGANYSDVVDRYGKNYTTTKLDDLTLYEYDCRSIDDKKGLLRFAVDRNNRVEYIGARIVAEPEPEPTPKVSENVRQAEAALSRYYEAMTNKDYYAAFNMFTNEHKGRMGGTVSKFSQGYRYTISCKIADIQLVSESDNVVVLNYVLDSRDRADGGILYQQFSGQAEMVRYGGEWKINFARSTRTKRFMER